MSDRRAIHALRARAAALALALALLPGGPAGAAGEGNAMLGVPAAGRSPAACLAAPAAASAEAPDAPAAPDAPGVPALAQAAPAPDAPARAPSPSPAPRIERVTRVERMERRRAVMDTTVSVPAGTRFELHNPGGRIAVETWKKSAVRLRVRHAAGDQVSLRLAGPVLRAAVASRHGHGPGVQFTVTVPPWMPIQLTGFENDVVASGLEGGLFVETVRGDIEVRRVAGAIELRSVEGQVDVAEANGTIKVSSVNDGVRLLRVTGDIEADAVNGDIQLRDLVSRRVEATTVNGAVLFDGPMLDDGRYRFSSHSGDVALAIAEQANATVSVATHAGEFAAAFPLRVVRSKPGKRFSFALGDGKAQVELESFLGAIQLFRPGDRELLGRFDEGWPERKRDRGMKWLWKGEIEGEAGSEVEPVGHGRRKSK